MSGRSSASRCRSSRLLFAAVTGALLIADLKQPKRFYYIFTRPQWGSWLVKGAFILLGYGVFASLWLLARADRFARNDQVLAIPAVLFGAGTAGYTAFLFGQCEGRDFWQTPLLLPTLLAQAGAGGAGVGLIVAPLFDLPDNLTTAHDLAAARQRVALAFLIWTELSSKGRCTSRLAQRAMTHGEYKQTVLGQRRRRPGRRRVRWRSLALVTGSWLLALVGGVAAIVGVALYEDAFVRAGQSVPLS